MTRSRFGIVPPCKIGKNHNWKGSDDKYGQSGICVKCGYDAFDKEYVED